jgi:Putative Flp pilus-assembly TadE/G-like
MIARLKSTRGMSLTLVAVSLTAMFGVGALAIDLGMMYRAHAEAEVAAEAGALAGASVFLDPPTGYYADSVKVDSMAREFAGSNSVLNRLVDSIIVRPQMATQQVEVTVVRPGIGTWFAWMLGDSLDLVDVGANATATVTESNAANCVAPIMLPDAWEDADEVLDPGTLWDEESESWSFDEQTPDNYSPYQGPGNQTGYGSDHRNPIQDYENDYGRPITLRPQVSPTSTGGPGTYRTWTFEGEDPEVRERTRSCDPRSVRLGTGGHRVAPNDESALLEELQQRIADDGGTSWDPGGGYGQGRMQSSTYSDWRQSPRIIKVALFDPGLYLDSMVEGSAVEFNNIVLFFVENVDQADGSIMGRLLFYAQGNTDAGDPGALVKRVKLIR